jgi:acetoin utilization deacetylase AcuC-like enzyme
VAYVDIDALHGDGVQLAFYDDPERPHGLDARARRAALPGTGFVRELRRG